MRATTLMIAALAFTVACGNPGKKSAEACEDWVAAFDCGDFDLAGAGINCSVYEEYDCDVSEYFDCLTDATTCEDDVADVTGWADCAAKATCE